jgi:geranylgeranyl reductase family protein
MHTTMHQVIVVGAGPAGSMAAAILASHGCRVLLLDKAEFPRAKVCGDGITLGTVRLLSTVGLELKMDKFHWCDSARGTSPRGYAFKGCLTEYNARAYVIPRKTLDHILWKFSLQRGTEFERFHVAEPIVERGVVCGIRGRLGGEVVEHHARITIAADGANSVITRALHRGKAADRHYAVSMRAYFDGVQGSDRCADFYASAVGGFPNYGWVFPLGEGRANVGVVLRLDALHRSGRTLRQEFDQFIRDPRTADRLSQAKLMGKIQGWTLPLASRPLQRAYAGALLVGDAGAFVSPLSGGGIHNGLVSGKLAAEVALEALQKNNYSLKGLGKFEAKWRRALGRGLRREMILQRVLSWPGLVDLALRNMERNKRLARFIVNFLAWTWKG